MPAAEFEPAIPATERLQTHAADHAATTIDHNPASQAKLSSFWITGVNKLLCFWYDYYRNKKQTHKQTMNCLLNINVTGDTMSQRKNSTGYC